MSGWLLFLLIFGSVVLYLVVVVRNFQAKERASNNRLDAHLTMLSSGIEDLSPEEENNVPFSSQPLDIDIKKLWGYPPPRKTVLGEVLDGDSASEGWDLAIHIHEAAEHYLGEELFLSLEKRVASLPGVEQCLHEDRDVFLISCKSYPNEILVELFWREFLHVAEIAQFTNK